MPRKIGHLKLATIDEKNHVRYWTQDDIVLDSIVFKADVKKETKNTPKKETKKETKTETKKK